MTALGVLVLFGTVIVAGGSSVAAGPPKFSGVAPGSVSCTFTATVKFSPPLTSKGGGTNPSAINGSLPQCTASVAAIAVTGGKVAGSYSASPFSCVTLGATSATPSLTVSWKASVTGPVSGTTYAGKAHLSQTEVSGGTPSLNGLSDANATGSFGYSGSISLPDISLSQACSADKNGLKKLTISGTLALNQRLVTSIATDKSGSYCAVLTSGDVYCWGYNGFGELGNNSTTDSSVPVHVRAVAGSGGDVFLGNVASVTSDGANSFCAVLTSGGVDCWGKNEFGELGDGSTTNSSVPVVVQNVGGGGALSGVVSMSGDDSESYCAVLTTIGVDCWGDNLGGDLGDGSDGVGSSVPVVVDFHYAEPIASIRGDGIATYCALDDFGVVLCWGFGRTGDLGDNSIEDSVVPVVVLSGVARITSDVPDPEGETYNGAGSFCAVLVSGGVDCWGDNVDDELGNGSSGGDALVPTSVANFGPALPVTQLVGGDEGYCGVINDANHFATCWGNNDYGQLGNNSTTNSDVPIIGVWGNVASVSSDGNDSFCAVTLNNYVVCWGLNEFGELGDNSTANSSVPEVALVGGVASISNQGIGSYCALLDSGGVDCWGDNSFGELGDDSTTNSSVPVAVSKLGP